MSERPRQVAQDARTEVQLLPAGITLEQLSTLLSDELLRTHAKLTRLQPDQVRDGALPGQRQLFMSLTAHDLPTTFRHDWRGSAELTIEHFEEHDAPAVQIRVGDYSGSQDEADAGNTARAAWRLADALERAFSPAKPRDLAALAARMEARFDELVGVPPSGAAISATSQSRGKAVLRRGGHGVVHYVPAGSDRTACGLPVGLSDAPVRDPVTCSRQCKAAARSAGWAVQ